MPTFSKNKKLIKKVGKRSLDNIDLDGFGKFLVIFSINIFLMIVKKKKKRMGQKTLFGDFSKIQYLAKNLKISIYSL